MRKIVSLLTVLMLVCALAYAQTRMVTGKVVDEKGIPIPFATVTQKGTKNGTSADAEGNFNLDVKNGNTIVISSTGYQTRELSVQGQNHLRVQLSTASNMIDEVIVTAGGIKAKRKEIGTATSVIKSEALTAGQAVNVAGGLQGKVAGLQINSTSGGVNPNFRIILRGQRSLTGNNQALLVLDNVIVPNEILGNLNPDDVEDVTVLNGAGAAALYGSQASNGALIVTTKKGKRGVTSIGVSHTSTVESVAFFPKIQTKFGAGGTAYGLDANGNPLFSYLENQSYGPAFDGKMRPLGPPIESGRQDSALYQYNDGHFKFWQKGITNQTDVNLSSGDENSTFYLSGQYVDVKGTTPGDKYNRAAFRINGTRKVGQKVNVTYTAGYTQNRYDITTQTGAMYGNMLNMPSNVDITRYKNWRTDSFANPNGYYNPWYQNPYFTADNYRSNQRNDYLVGNIEIRFTPVKGLDLIGRQGITTRNYSNKNTVGAFQFTDYAKNTDQSSKSDIPASVSDGSSFKTQLLTDFLAQYNTKVNDFSFTLIGGAQWTQNAAKYLNIGANGLIVPGLFNVNNGVGTPDVSESNYKSRQVGAYGDFRLGYKNYLFLHATGRNDWVSILSEKNHSFFYPSADLSFIVSDAVAAVKESNVISYLKLRAGWSKVGQVNLGNSSDFGAYYLLPTYSGSASGFPYGSLPGYTVGNTLVSNDLKPEITKGYEAGFDLNLFKDRFVSNLTYFSTKTNNQTVNTRISNATGFSTLLTNTGETQSRGLEVTAHVTPLRTKDWTVTIGGNYTYLDNKVNNISAQLPRLSLATYGTDGPGSYAVAGQVFPVIMGYDYKRDPQGHVIVSRTTGLPTKSDTISILGNATPKQRLGIDGSIKFKNLTFSFLFDYRGSYQVYNAMGTELDWSGTGYRTAIYDRQRFVFPNSVYDDGTGKYVTNTSITVPNGNGNNGFWTDGINRDVTSNYVTSGDFWKLREIALAYDLPASILNKTKFVKGARISVQARNLFVWLAKDNYYTDPEYSDSGNDSNGIGLTGLGQTPPSRFYGATISVKF
ncbi:MAG: SusC/RagA family TonB-linked outer membrane protein [Flavisolibacter sp.]